MPIKRNLGLVSDQKASPGILMQQAMTVHNQGDLKQAARRYQQILSISPKHFDAMHLLAVVNAQLNQFERSRDLFNRALSLRPHHSEAHFNKGTMEKAAGALDAAAIDFSCALEGAPGHLGALNNRSLVLLELRLFKEALSDSDRLLKLSPKDAVVHNNRGMILHQLGRLDEALESFDQAVSLKSDYVEAFNNRGNVLKDMHRLHDAISDYDSAIAIDAEFAAAPFNKGIALLLMGELEAGWELWEWRWRQQKLTSPKRDFSAPLWNGDRDIAGKTILLHSEQGLGDTVQFIRYAPMVADLGARVVVEAPTILHSLFAGMMGIDLLLAKGEAAPAFDFHCPLMSLPRAFQTTIETVPAPSQYLVVSPDRVNQWASRLGSPSRLRVALAWRGNSNNSNDGHRSATLVQIVEHLAQDIDWICLHHDLTEDEQKLVATADNLLAPLDERTDLEDAAAICAVADFVFTVDTSFAHIAGALGKKSFVMLPATPDWRWLLGRNDSPWYPSMTLFRKGFGCDWAQLTKVVVAELHKVKD